MDSDEILLRAWRDGDRAAGDRLVHRYFLSIYNFFRTKAPAEALDDLTQRTFLACAEAHAKNREVVSFRAYLFGIARKQLLYFSRQQQSRRRLFEPREVRAEDLGTSPTGQILRHDEQRLLLRALRSIPMDFQMTLELFYWEELSGAEIASVLEIATGTVRSRLTRAKGMLREAIAELGTSENVRRSTLDHLERWVRSVRGALADDDAAG